MYNFSNLLQTPQINILFKIGFLIANFIFIIFLIVVIREVRTMSTIVSNNNNTSTIKSAILLLFIVAVSLFLTALVIL
jgi:hypothetical protein